MTRVEAIRVAIAVERSPICCREQHCGSKAAIGPCRPVEGACNHDVTCLRCSATGVESWNLEVGAAEHARARCES